MGSAAVSMSGYAVVAQVRLRELKTRIALAAFIAGVAWVLAPSIWPAVWFAAVCLSQWIDWLVFRPVRRNPAMNLTTNYKILCCAITTLSVVIYATISTYIWFRGGETARVFAIVQIAGGLLHVSLHMHQQRALLLSAVIPHSLFFLGLPVASAIIDHHPQILLIAVGCLLYMSHLIVTVRQSSLTTKVLQDANRLADEERQKAEVASAAKSDFLAVISHEIRTPMNAVISAANLLRSSELTPSQRDHVAMLTDAGDVLVGLLNDVLDLSKIEAGKMQLETAPMNLRDKLSSLVRLWEPKALEKGVSLDVGIADNVPEAISTDPLRVQQILFNLLSNAVKFTDVGVITVRMGWDDAAGVLTVSVRDTGCGIPADRLASIFDSFEQVDAGTTRRYGGTGLGLAISRRLAQIMGGDLTVDSVLNQGTVFELTLPSEVVAAPAVRARGLVSPLTGEGLAGRRILAAEDHPVNRQILTLLLEPHGCRLTLVENGLEAVEIAKLQVFDAILMDMQMPVMDGVVAARLIRAAGQNCDTPVIALTANAMDVHRAAWEEVGVYAFLTKPIDPVLLAETLAQACAFKDQSETVLAASA